jgi:hypothetical protein
LTKGSRRRARDAIKPKPHGNRICLSEYRPHHMGCPDQQSADNLLALVRGWIARVVRCVTKVRDGFRCGLIEPLLTLQRLRPYRSSNRTARRDPRSGCMPVPRPPTTLRRGNWTMADRRLSPYRSRASPTPKLPAFTNLHYQPLSCAQACPQFLQSDRTGLPRATRAKS